MDGRLHFTFRVSGGAGKLALSDQSFFGWLKVERLELEVPNLELPIDTTEEPERFQRRRTSVRVASLRLDQRDIDRFVAERAPRLAQLGIDEVQVRCWDGYATSSARVREDAHAAELSFRIYLAGEGLDLRVMCSSPRVYGFLPTPAPVIAHRLLEALLLDGRESDQRVRMVGLGAALITPLSALLWKTLPAAGWRLPALGDVGLVAARATRGSLQVSYGPNPAPLSSSRDASNLGGRLERFFAADERLRRGDHDNALRAYRGELASGGPEQPFVIERLLAISSASPSSFSDATELARQTLGRWPDFAPAHAALASVAVARGDTREAANRYRRLWEIADREGDDEGAARAALAGARLLRTLAPTESTPLYEHVLEHRPGHAEAAEALSERYAAENRWHDSVRLIRSRLQATGDPRRKSRDHLRLAKILIDHLDDPSSAQAELEKASALDPDHIAALTALADACLRQNNSNDALAALDSAAERYRARGDARAEADACSRAGQVLLDAGDTEAARLRFGRALELVPGHSTALRGAAEIAQSDDRTEEAIELWRRLMEVGGHPPVEYAEYSCRLAECLLAAGRRAEAVPHLERAADHAHVEVASRARVLLADLHRDSDPEASSSELAAAVGALLQCAQREPARARELHARAARIALERARFLFDQGEQDGALLDYQRAYDLAVETDTALAREAAREMIQRASGDGDREAQRRWMKALLDAEPEPAERLELLIARAELVFVHAKDDAELRSESLADLEAALALDPGEAERARVLELEAWIFGASGDLERRAQALEERAALATNPAEAARTAAAAAAAWLETERDGDALTISRRALESLDRLDAKDHDEALVREVHAALGEAAWRKRHWSEVVRAYRPLVSDAALTDRVRARCAHRLGIALEKQGEDAEAASALQMVVDGADAPGDIRSASWKLLADLYERLGELHLAAITLEAFAADADAETSDSTRADAWYRAGELYRKHDQSNDDAERCLEAALAIVRDHLPALDALERIKREAGEHERVAVILGRKIAATAGHLGRQKALLGRLAALQLELGRADVAREIFNRALEIDPDYRPALRLLAGEAAERGDVREAVKLYARLAADLPGDGDLPDDPASLEQARVEAARTACAMAVERPELADSAAVALANARHLLEALDGETAAQVRAERAAIEGILSGASDAPELGAGSNAPPAESPVESPAPAKPAQVLPQNEAQADDATSIEFLQMRAAELERQSRPAARKAAADAYLELADLFYDQEEDPVRARAAMRRAADLMGPGARRDATLRMLAAEASAAGVWADAASAYVAIEPERLTSSDRLTLAQCYQHLGRDRAGIELLEAARASGGLSDDGAMLLFALHREAERKAELAASLERGTAHAPLHAARSRLREALALYEESLEDAEAAERVRELLATLEVSGAGDEDEGHHPLESAAEDAIRNGDSALAAELLSRAVEARARALAGHEAGLDDATSSALDRLRMVARAGEHFESLVRGLASVVAVELPAETTIELLGELAALRREHLSDPRGAADALERALAIAPGDHRLLAELDAVLREIGDLSALTSAYELHLSVLEGHLRARPLFELACIHRDAFNDPERGGELLIAAHEADQSLAEVWLPLARYHDLRGAPALARPLYDLVLDWVELTDDERKRIEARADELDEKLREVAEEGEEVVVELVAELPIDEVEPDDSRAEEELRIAAELTAKGQIDAAIAHYEQAAAARPADRAPLEALESLYARVGEHDALTEVLGRLIVATEEPAERAQLWYRRAKLYRDVLHRGPEAYRCLKEAHVNAPDDGEIAHSLRTIAMARSEWALAAELLYREINATTEPLEAGMLHLELGLIYDEKLLDAEQARRNYEEALRLDPESPAAPRPLARLYELGGRFAEAAQMGELAAERSRTGTERGQLLRRAATNAERAGLAHDARRLYNLAALTADDAEESRAAQAALVRLGGSHENASELLELRLREAEGEERLDLLRQLLEEASTSGDSEAVSRWATLLFEADHTDLSAYLTLKARASDEHDLPTLSRLLDTRASAIADQAESASLYFELGRLYQNDMGDPNGAIGAYEQALGADPDHPAALESLAELAYEKNDWPRALQLYERLRPESCSMPADRIAQRRGEIAEVLGREHDAMDAFAEAASLNPGNRTALTALARTAVRLGMLKTAIDAGQALLDLIPSGDVTAITAARLHLAELCHENGELDRAIDYYEMVLSEKPKSLPALRALVGLYAGRGDYEASARKLRALIALSPTPTGRAELLFQLGELYLHAGQHERASDTYLKAIDLEPSHTMTLRRLLSYYWSVDDSRSLLEIAEDLAAQSELVSSDTEQIDLARVMIASAIEDNGVALTWVSGILAYLDQAAPVLIAEAFVEAAIRGGPERAREQLAAAARKLASVAGSLDRAAVAAHLAELSDRSPTHRALAEALAAVLAD